MKLSEIEATLRQVQVKPVRSLGQNFLHDQNIAQLIVREAEIGKDDLVLEIGPGLGALTGFVLDTGTRVIALEKDGRLAEFLAKRFAESPLEVRHMDALDFDPRELFAAPSTKCLGNLPYYIASELLFHFIKQPSPISMWLFMLQNEMARRLTAVHGTGAYGVMTLLVNLHHRVEYLRSVSARVFLPQPEVGSALIRIVPRAVNELPWCDEATFARLVRQGFSQRRKQLRNLLGRDVFPWEQAASAVGFPEQARAEDLSLLQWVELARWVSPPPPDIAKKEADELFPVVDAQDRFERLAPRAEVHGNNLRHRAVHVLIFSPEGDLFLQRRSRWKDRHPGQWDSSAAGHVSGRDSYEVTARREVLEELGIEAEFDLVGRLGASERTGEEFINLYRATHPGPFRLNPAEIEEGSFFPPELVTKWAAARPRDFAPGFLACWELYCATHAGLKAASRSPSVPHTRPRSAKRSRGSDQP